MLEIRKKLLIKAVEKAAEHFPLTYALLCVQNELFHLVVKFKDMPNLYATDMHDYIYVRFGLDPRFYVVNSLNPLTKIRMLKECEFIYGDREEYERDLEEAEREADKFAENLRAVARLYGVLKNE